MASPSKNPKPNVPYTRTDIQRMCHGELQTYLPQRKKIILAGCFAIERMNPDAPEMVYVGNAPKVVEKALLLSRQPETVFPVFTKQKRTSKHYYFVGKFRFKSLSNDPKKIAAAEAVSDRHDELAYVLHLRAA